MLSFTLMPSSAWTKFFKRCRFFTLIRSLLRFLFPFMCLGKSFGELFQSHCHRTMSYCRYGRELFSNIIRNISTLTLSLSLFRIRNIVVNTRQTNSFNVQPFSRFHSQKTSSHARSTVSFQHIERRSIFMAAAEDNVFGGSFSMHLQSSVEYYFIYVYYYYHIDTVSSPIPIDFVDLLIWFDQMELLLDPLNPPINWFEWCHTSWRIFVSLSRAQHVNDSIACVSSFSILGLISKMESTFQNSSSC